MNWVHVCLCGQAVRVLILKSYYYAPKIYQQDSPSKFWVNSQIPASTSPNWPKNTWRTRPPNGCAGIEKTECKQVEAFNYYLELLQLNEKLWPPKSQVGLPTIIVKAWSCDNCKNLWRFILVGRSESGNKTWCAQCVVQIWGAFSQVEFAMDGARELLASGSDWFWNERRWLPPNVTWAELEDLANKHPNNYRYNNS